ncbi:MAG: TIGR02444 family protein, partial [Alphaproteobacteria bacterium]
MHGLWEFAVAVYGAADVRARLLDLQDGHGCDVPLLLALAWLDVRGVAVDAPRYAALADASAAWQREVVTRLRAARRALRP